MVRVSGCMGCSGDPPLRLNHASTDSQEAGSRKSTEIRGYSSDPFGPGSLNTFCITDPSKRHHISSSLYGPVSHSTTVASSS
jgi:hypothetical protein